MFSVSVRDHVMIAHSLRGSVFGPAQRLHGATYVVEIELRRPRLDQDGIVTDIGRATALLASTLEPLRYQNLDEITALRGLNTTTEALCHWIHTELARHIRAGELGPGAEGLSSLRVVLHESHVAYAAYDAELSPP